MLKYLFTCKKLEILDINEEETNPEKTIYQEEEHKRHRDRQETIVFQTGRKVDKEGVNGGQEPMLKVSSILLRFQKGSEDIVNRFELSNSVESSKTIALRQNTVLIFVHSLLLIMVFLNMKLLPTNSQILILILKASQCGSTFILLMILPKVS